MSHLVYITLYGETDGVILSRLDYIYKGLCNVPLYFHPPSWYLSQKLPTLGLGHKTLIIYGCYITEGGMIIKHLYLSVRFTKNGHKITCLQDGLCVQIYIANLARFKQST
jgi:hypothetical protein